jgi:ribosomal protein S27AE
MAGKKPIPIRRMHTGRPRKRCECGEGMIVAKKAKNWKSFWLCEKCGAEQPKVKGDVEYWG